MNVEATSTIDKAAPPAFHDDDSRWQAVSERNHRAEGHFIYAVRSTGIYCRPVCGAKLPLRKNVRFFNSPSEAEQAGFRACRRCKPKENSFNQHHTAAVAKACRLIETADQAPSLEELARAAGLSSFHFHRIFKQQTALTPKRYAAAHRMDRARQELQTSGTVTEAIYAAGFNASSRFYETATTELGMTPKRYRAGGANVVMQFAFGECWLGSVLVAATTKGICAILLGDSTEALHEDLERRFPNAVITPAASEFTQTIAAVVRFLEAPEAGFDLPLDVQGTAFQRRIWQALREIPSGMTMSYSELSQKIGKSNATRAVASACAANPIAVAIPCHRIVRSDGSVSGYRWGPERKKELLKREKERAKPQTDSSP